MFSAEIGAEQGMEKFQKNALSKKDISSQKDRKLKGLLKRTEKKIQETVEETVNSEFLLVEEEGFLEAEGLEKTFKFKQEDIKKHLGKAQAKKGIDLSLDLGPYKLDYTRNGQHLLIGGKKGHVAGFNWRNGKINFEIQLKEKVNDVKWLQNETMFAVAQRKYVYIYDHSGVELHCLRKHVETNCLEFLPYHYLLTTIGNKGKLRYQDVSTGLQVAEFGTKLGDCKVMTSNPSNAIVHLGHAEGTVTLWSPTCSSPLVKMLCHRGPVTAVAVDHGGNYMATSGLDGQLKIWDIRTYKPLQSYYTLSPASSISLSQKNLMSVTYGPHVTIWKDCFLTKQESPYMYHLFEGQRTNKGIFCPFDDILTIGHSSGVSSLIIPGSGEPNFDALELNPFQNKRQRQEGEIKGLLDKLQPEMISLDIESIGNIQTSDEQKISLNRRLAFEANNKTGEPREKNRARGRNSAAHRYMRKRHNVVDERKLAFQQKLEEEKKSEQPRYEDKTPFALRRFKKK